MLGSVRAAKTSFLPHVQQPWGFMLAHSAAFVLYCKKQQGCLVPFCCCNLSPRGDGNDEVNIAQVGGIVATYPREGTETRRRHPLREGLRLQLIPARGRKRELPLTRSSWSRCNLSPRGDGNSQAAIAVSYNRRVATYPREGTETLSTSCKVSNFLKLQLIPARGRKLGRKLLFNIVKALQLIPARGRKRRDSASFCRTSQLQLIPARGQKTLVIKGQNRI